MNQNVAIGIVVVLALAAAGYLWYSNDTTVPFAPQEEAVTTEETAPTNTQIATGIEGSWRSQDDAKFTRSFNANGQVTDRYEGDSSVSGHYEVNGDHIPAQVRAVAGNSPVLSIEFPEEALFFLVTKVNASELELVYIGGNGTLRFTRI